MTLKMTAQDIEIAVADFFGSRVNLIVPNVSWGMGLLHECDLIVLTPAGYAYQVEIKVSKADLIKDQQKKHGHSSQIISRLYFAIPDYLQDCINEVPDHAGILIVYGGRYAKLIRPPITQNKYKWTPESRAKLMSLACMRIFTLKKHNRVFCRKGLKQL